MSRKAIAGVALLAAAVVATVAVVSLWGGVHVLGGHAQHASFTSDGKRLVVVDRSRSRSSSVPRVRVHDPLSGAELGRAGLASGPRMDGRDPSRLGEINCLPASPELVWCHDWSGRDGLSLRRLDTLAVVADEERLRRTAPALAGGTLRDPFDRAATAAVDPDDGALLVLATDGRYYRIGTDLQARVEPKLPPAAIDFEHGGRRATTTTADFGDHTLRLAQRDPGGKRSMINVAMKGSPNWGGAPPHPDESFLDASFVADGNSGKALMLSNPPGVILVHYLPKGDDKQVVLTRIGADATSSWSAPLPADDVIAAHLVGDTLVVVFRETLVGLDPQSGALRYDREL